VLPVLLLTKYSHLSLGEALKLTIFVHIVAEFVGSLWLALSFQLSHIFDGAGDIASITTENNQKKIDLDWAVSQLATTQDYCHDSTFWAFVTGALNYQVVHHLLPDVAQHHYPTIAPVVKQVCQEYGLPYLYTPSFSSVLKSHYQQLKNLSEKPSQ